MRLLAGGSAEPLRGCEAKLFFGFHDTKTSRTPKPSHGSISAHVCVPRKRRERVETRSLRHRLSAHATLLIVILLLLPRGRLGRRALLWPLAWSRLLLSLRRRSALASRGRHVSFRRSGSLGGLCTLGWSCRSSALGRSR